MSTWPGPSPGPDRDSVVRTLRAAGCVFAEDEARLLIDAATSADDLAATMNRRVAGEPLEYILGWAEFCGLRIAVEPGVFVPRRRSEFLAEQAAAVAGPGAVVLDLCCGTGALGAAVVAVTTEIELHASDVDPVAVRCARRNLRAAGAPVYEGDLYAALPVALRGRIDVIVANAPYVPSDDIGLMPREAWLYEARAALDGGSDGLAFHRRIADAAPHWLVPGGRLLIETSARQSTRTANAMTRSGLSAQVVHDRDRDATVVVGHSN